MTFLIVQAVQEAMDSKIEEDGFLLNIDSKFKNIDIPAMKVNQLDAAQLDKEMLLMLSIQFRKIFMYYKTDIISRFKPESDLLLRGLLYKYTILIDVTTPGNELQNLKFSSGYKNRKLSYKQKLGYFILFVLGPYIWERFNIFIRTWGISNDNQHNNNQFNIEAIKENIYLLCRKIEKYYKLLYVSNIIIFLYSGKYRNIFERILGIRLIYERSRVARQVNFEFMNQQLMWHGFSEFFLFMLPLVNFNKISSFFRHAFFTPLSVIAPGCPVCQEETITTPYIASCGHTFCYYCLTSARLAEASVGGGDYHCPTCEQVIISAKAFTVANEE